MNRTHTLLTALLLAALSLHAAETNPPAIELLKEVTIGDRAVNFARLPAGLRVDEKLALVLASPAISGQVVHVASDWLYETRATKTPGATTC
jgi:hypothetical protein